MKRRAVWEGVEFWKMQKFRKKRSGSLFFHSLAGGPNLMGSVCPW